MNAASVLKSRFSLAALGFVLAGLVGRALIDKILSAQGGAVAVAGWAQLSNLADLVTNVSLAGLGTALTVMVAGHVGEQRAMWLKPAFVMSLVLSFAVAAGGFIALAWIDKGVVPASGPKPIFALAAGWFLIAPALIVALLLGLKRAGQATLVIALGFVLPLAFLAWSPWDSPLTNLLAGQAAWGAAFCGVLAIHVYRQPPMSGAAVRTLLQFVPASLVIGILSPAATAWARAEMAAGMSWQAAGQVQALWRASEWVTLIMSGVLNAHFLPRLSASADRRQFLAELGQALRWTALPAALCLAVLWLFLPQLLAVLYRSDIGVAREDAVFFLLGDWVRIMSWVFLFGLFARRAAWAITWGEFLSLPLFALLLAVFAGSYGVREVGMFWLLSYIAYAAFNAITLWRSMRKF